MTSRGCSIHLNHADFVKTVVRSIAKVVLVSRDIAGEHTFAWLWTPIVDIDTFIGDIDGDSSRLALGLAEEHGTG